MEICESGYILVPGVGMQKKVTGYKEVWYTVGEDEKGALFPGIQFDKSSYERVLEFCRQGNALGLSLPHYDKRSPGDSLWLLGGLLVYFFVDRSESNIMPPEMIWVWSQKKEDIWAFARRMDLSLEQRVAEAQASAQQ